MLNLIKWLYGSNPRSEHIRKNALDLIEILNKEGSVNYKELLKRYKMLKPNGRPKRIFYKIVNPLKDICLLKVIKKRTEKSWDTRYMLTPEIFEGFMKSEIKRIVRNLS